MCGLHIFFSFTSLPSRQGVYPRPLVIGIFMGVQVLGNPSTQTGSGGMGVVDRVGAGDLV